MAPLTVTIVQTNLHWENKDANLKMLAQKIDGIKEKTEVVILPEMFSTGFSMKAGLLSEKMDGETIQWMKKMATLKKIILTGSIIAEDDGNYFNRLIWMLPDGEYGYYDKRHLFAFANEDKHYKAGNKKLIASVKGWKVNLQICYDLRFPVWTRQPPIPADSYKNAEAPGVGYDVTIFVANWPEKRITAWKTLLQARAIENQCYVIGVNRVGEDGNKIHYTGDSMIIDPMGEILYQKTNAEDIFTFTLSKEKLHEVREKFPFWRDADYFKL